MAQSNVNMSKLKRSFQMLTAKIPQRTIASNYTWDVAYWTATSQRSMMQPWNGSPTTIHPSKPAGFALPGTKVQSRVSFKRHTMPPTLCYMTRCFTIYWTTIACHTSMSGKSMLQILEERYERKSVIIASQLPIAKWYDYIGDPTLADAIAELKSWYRLQW